MVAEYNAANVLQRRYVHGPGVDEPVVWYEGTTLTDKRWLMSDERGSIISVTNGAGTVLGINRYDEYGIYAPTNLGRFQYTGQMLLPEAGLYHYKARAYSPTLGRFMQTDPIGYGDGMNFYNYVGSDPVNFVDPTGMNYQVFTRCIAVTVEGYAPSYDCVRVEAYFSDQNYGRGGGYSDEGVSCRISRSPNCVNDRKPRKPQRARLRNPYCVTNGGREIRGQGPKTLDDGVVTLHGINLDLALGVGAGVTFYRFTDSYSGSEGIIALGSAHAGLLGSLGYTTGVAPNLAGLLGNGYAFRAGAMAQFDSSFNDDGLTAIETGVSAGGGVAASKTRARIISSNIPDC